ncbi:MULTISPECIES: type I 3-dehydroquinate dehydratase [Thermococcus]|uniref:3-dehydroquinate dehydratase n=1 Tax=Thermococcus sibiricus TaxID=172049 RepID=A0A124FFF7_9EURY|nr:MULTISPECIES: type I 3-dehydroquinate dehydratase [Thermococcus]KUK17946.1 MAG: 3-dehydroquinate dehydratase [Thermococcus sibiricus]KUK29313.1 MAG: 3-dehydroquinate dehydratase [Thermococcus sp. 40_45]MBC7094617.1 type I 3-dehydroquinate dehydratase [Thermococcus sp.]HII67905.1 type I 3-dehydroquinate dehydratase [Thermococcaceae archaeon]
MIAGVIKAKTVNEAIKIIENGRTDLYELRVDAMKSFEGIEKLRSFAEKLIITVRSKEEGGFREIRDEERIKLFEEFMRINPAFVDIEFRSKIAEDVIRLIREREVRVILSYHDFEKTPSFEELKTLLEEMKKLKADLIKIVTFAKHYLDNVKIVRLYEHERNLIAFCMGEKGKISRAFSLVLSPFTYASLDEASAPGQLSLEDMELLLALLGGEND